MLLLLSLVITSIYCSYDSCIDESEHSKCSSHIIDEVAGFSCHLFLDDSSDVNVEGDFYSKEYCSIYPDSAEKQKTLWNIEQGFTKETMSVHLESIDKYSYVAEPQKEFYEKNETVLIRKKSISKEDREIISSKNTCGYQFIGRIKEDFTRNYNLKDKHICFNTKQFPEFKKLINCGYATFTFNKAGEIFTINTCYFIPDNLFPDDFQIVFWKMFIANGFISLVDTMYELGEISWNFDIVKLDEINVEMIVEDKYGKKLKYFQNRFEPEIITEGAKICPGIDFFMEKCNPNIITKSSDIIISNYIYDILDDIEDGKFNEIFDKVINENKTYDAKENNITYIISTVSSQYFTNYSTVALEACESLLKEKFVLNKNESLILLKLEYNIEKFKIPIIEYQFFLKNGTRIDLSYCESLTENVSIPVKINEAEEFIHNPHSFFYNDKCSIYTSEYDTDLSMYDRKNNYNEQYLALCEKNCEYKRYNGENRRVECECKTKTKFPELVDILMNGLGFNLKDLLHQFRDVIKHWNLFLFKCYKVVFSSEGLKNNSGSYLNIIFTTVIIFCTIFFGIKGYTLYKKRIINIANQTLDNCKQNKEQKNKNELNNPEKTNNNTNTTCNNAICNNNSFSNYFDSQININIKLVKYYNDFEMNNLDYNKALIEDNRTFCQMYISFIKIKHPIYSTFFLKNDYNSKIIKICLFIFSFTLDYAINALFFNDSTMHTIYVDRGDYNFIYQIPQIIYSFLISFAITKLLSFFILSEEKVSEIIQTKNLEIENKINDLFKKSIYKLIIFFVLLFLFHLLFFYYLSSFCGVYRNTQGALITNTIINFAFSLFIYFFIFCLIPCTMRYYSLRGIKKNRKCLYKTSNIISDIIL